MRVLSISSDDPTLRLPGSPSRLRAEAYARALGEVVDIATTTGRRESHPLRAGAFSAYRTGSWSRLLAPFDAARLAARLGGDVVTAQDPFEHGLAGLIASCRLRIPLHVQLHTDPFSPGFAQSSLLNRIRVRIMPYVLKRATRIRVVAPRLAREIEGRYAIPTERITVLPIYTDLARFRGLRRTPERGALLWVGRFEREKDPMLALEGLAAARAAGVNARLTMLGEGRLKRAVLARAKARGLLEYLDLPGHADPLPYLAAAELVLATSRYEGYGLAIVEALAAGCPTLSTNVGVALAAGAVIAPRESFPKQAAELLRDGPAAPSPVRDPYPSFEAYVEAYVEDIRACARQAP